MKHLSTPARRLLPTIALSISLGTGAVASLS